MMCSKYLNCPLTPSNQCPASKALTQHSQKDKILTFPRRNIPRGCYLPSWGCWEISGGSQLRSAVPSDSELKHRAMNQTHSNSVTQLLSTVKLAGSVRKVIVGSCTVQCRCDEEQLYNFSLKQFELKYEWSLAIAGKHLICQTRCADVFTSLDQWHSLTMKYFSVGGCGQTTKGNVVVAGKREDDNWNRGLPE